MITRKNQIFSDKISKKQYGGKSKPLLTLQKDDIVSDIKSSSLDTSNTYLTADRFNDLTSSLIFQCKSFIESKNKKKKQDRIKSNIKEKIDNFARNFSRYSHNNIEYKTDLHEAVFTARLEIINKMIQLINKHLNI